MPWWMYIVGGVISVVCFGVAMFFWVLEDEEVRYTAQQTAPPPPDEQGRDDWRTSR